MRPPKWYESLLVGTVLGVGSLIYASRDRASIEVDPPVKTMFGIKETRPKNGHCLDFRFTDRDRIAEEKLYLNGRQIENRFLMSMDTEIHGLRRMFIQNSDLEKGKNEIRYEAIDKKGNVNSDVVYIDN